MKTITIIGGGLGGLSLGVYLRRLDVPVRLIEARSYPRHKVCGEFICGLSPEWIQTMGIDNIIEDSVHHHQMRWWMAEREVISAEMPTVAWGLSRYKLDQDLSRKFLDLGGEMVLDEKREPVSGAGIVLGVGKKKNTGSDWVGLKIHVRDLNTDGLEMHVGRSGYVGLCGVEDGNVNVCGLFKIRKELRGSGLLLQYLRANGLGQLAARIESATIIQDSFCATAGFQLGEQGSDGGFRLGDAAYLIPPFTGNGMSMAIESAYLAGEILRQYSFGKISWEQAEVAHRSKMHDHFHKRMKWAETLHPLLFSTMGRAALQATASVLPIQYLFSSLRSP